MSTSSHRRIESATCLGCGCACDDLTVELVDGHVVRTSPPCTASNQWFSRMRTTFSAHMDGTAADTTLAVTRLASHLTAAVSPLIYLAPQLSCAAQRHAVALADFLKASADSISSTTALSALLITHERGKVAMTLGELRARADVLIFWGVDPEARHTRFASRFVRDGVRVVAVDIGTRRGAGIAPERIAIDGHDEAGALAATCGLLRDAVPTADTPPAAITLNALIRSARYVAIIYDAEPSVPSGIECASALAALAEALHNVTRGGLCALRGGGNRCGADAVLTWQTGYPAAVSFEGGHPEYDPPHTAADTLMAADTVDFTLIVGAASDIPERTLSAITAIPHAIVGPDATKYSSAAIAIDTGIAGLDEAGLAFRMDDVPVNLCQVVDGAPTATGVLQQLLSRCLRHD